MNCLPTNRAVPTLTILPAAQNTGTTLTLTCELAGFTNALMNFDKDGATVYTCGIGGQTCVESGGLSDYSEVDWSQTDKGIVTISNADQTRDGGGWTCAVGGGGTSVAVTLAITDADCQDLTKPTNGEVTVTTTTYLSEAKYLCDSGYRIDGTATTTATTTCQADGTWSSEPTCTAAVNEGCFKVRAGCTAGVVVGITYGTSWSKAAVVKSVMYKIDPTRLPWHLCGGHLKKWWIWLLLIIFVPYVPSVVAIYLFKTKGPGYDRCVGAPGADVSINFKYTVSSSGEVTVQVKNEAGTELVSVKYIGGNVAGNAVISPRVNFTGNFTTGDLSFKLNNIQTSDSGLYTLSSNDVTQSCVTLNVTDKPTSGTEMNKFGESDKLKATSSDVDLKMTPNPDR